jgi:predicted nucleic acid-binding OB-fold protein
LPQESDKELIEQVRRFAGLTDNDNVRIFVVPKGQTRIQTSSVIIRPNTSPQAQQISLNISRSQRRLHEIEKGINHDDLSDEEKSRLKGALQSNVRSYERALARERARIATMPRSGWIIVEREN